MGAYLVRYTTSSGTFYHNPGTEAENLMIQASGKVSAALVIGDEWEAKLLAKIYQHWSKKVEVLECRLAVGSMVYHGPTDPEFSRGVKFDSSFERGE